MSLILEALRKSEAERRRGQTPDLLTDAIPVTPAARRRTPNWTVLLPVTGAALITLLLVLWWLRPAEEPAPDGNAANDASLDATAAAGNPGTTEWAHGLGARDPFVRAFLYASDTDAARACTRCEGD